MSFKLKIVTSGSEDVHVAAYQSYKVADVSGKTNFEPEYKVYTPSNSSSLIFRNAINGISVDTPAVEKKLNNDNIIKNISFDQSEILWNIMQLYNNGEPFECDMTASELKFYGKRRGYAYEIPVPKILFDVYPKNENIQKIDKWGNLPLEDNAIHSIVIDLPFVVSPAGSPSAVNPKKGSQLIARRFAAYYPVDSLYISYYHWISESYRVLDYGGICVFKTQSVISGGVAHRIEEFSFMAAQKLGFKCVDRFTLQAKARLISNAKMPNGQQHSRSYTSSFFVFRKDKKFMSKEFNYFDLLERCEKEQKEGFINVVEK